VYSSQAVSWSGSLRVEELIGGEPSSQTAGWGSTRQAPSHVDDNVVEPMLAMA
jgi:hypothetical protein